MSAAYAAIVLVPDLPDEDVIELEDIGGAAIPEPPRSGVKTIQGERSSLVVPRDREVAFRAIYEAHASFVWRNLRRLGVSERDVEDKVQEVFVVAHRRWADFADRGHGPRAWLFQISLRVAADARRHHRRHPIDPDGGAAEERQSIEPPQAEAIAQRQSLELLDRALATIDIERRAVLVLHEIEQMTAPEISRTLEIPLNTVYSRLRAARMLLERAVAALTSQEVNE